MPTLTHGYNEQNHLETLTEDGETTTYIYDAVGNLKETQFPNGVVERQTYDELNRLQVLETVKVEAGVETLLTKFEYQLDDVGHRLEVKETLRQPNDSLLERTVKYEYDDLYRLTSEEVVGGDKVTFTYDDVGNRASQTINGVTTTYIYDDNDRLLQELIDGVVVVSYTYDANGNTTSRTKDGVTTNYIWDDQNRLVEVQTPDGIVNYAYDDENIRVSETVDGVTTSYLLDKNRPYGQVLAEYTDGVLDASYVYGLDLIEQERDGDEYYYSVDGLGSTRGLTDENGEVTDSYAYDAFGNLISSTGGTENDYLFAGEQFDERLGQYYLRQRYYDAATGRFTRRDTYEGRLSEPITLHKYVYGNSNPIRFIDPTGLFSSLNEVSAANSLRTTIANIYGQIADQALNVISSGGSLSLEGLATELAWNLAPAVLDAGKDFIKVVGRSVKSSAERAKILHKGLNLGKFNPKGGSNLAFADIRLGRKGKDFSGTLVAVSGNTKVKTITGSELAPSGLVGNPSGRISFIPEVDAFLRDKDTEIKILEAFANKYYDNRYVKGKIYMFSERKPCKSCKNVIRKFKEMFPNIELEVASKY